MGGGGAMTGAIASGANSGIGGGTCADAAE